MPIHDAMFLIFPWQPAQRDDALALLPLARGRYSTESTKWHRGSYEKLLDLEMSLRRLSRTSPAADNASEREVSNQRVNVLHIVRHGQDRQKRGPYSVCRFGV